MDHLSAVILSDEKGLVSRDLSRVYGHFHSSSALPTSLARFKKKESLESMAKSIIKHRIQTLTGQNMADIEQHLGYSIKAGTGISVEQIRRLAHFLILESNGLLRDPPMATEEAKPPPQASTSSSSRKRALTQEVETTAQQSQKRSRSSRKSAIGIESAPMATPTLTARRGRKSLAPEMMRAVACNLVPEKKVEELMELVEEEEEDETFKNMTPQMIALKKRKSMMETKGKKLSVKSPEKKTVAVTSPEKKSFTGASFVNKEGKDEISKIFLALVKDPTKIDFKSLRNQIPIFSGCNLAVVHTPIQWEPPEVFNMVQSIRQLNKEAGLHSFLVLVGCGISNVHMFREALFRQTRHVQFVVFERDDQNAGINDGKLRDTTSFFLLAYFFPGSQKEGSVLPDKMVRVGGTTCFRTKNIEDLENAIVHTMSESGDWVLDLCCRSRELSLAAQKSGRYAVAIEVEEEGDKLAVLREKAAAIAKHYDRSFKNEDGVIIRL